MEIDMDWLKDISSCTVTFWLPSLCYIVITDTIKLRWNKKDHTYTQKIHLFEKDQERVFTKL